MKIVKSVLEHIYFVIFRFRIININYKLTIIRDNTVGVYIIIITFKKDRRMQNLKISHKSDDFYS